MSTTEAPPRLTADKIVATAAAIVMRDGLAALSMRHLADELGASTMAAYRHIPSREALGRSVALLIADQAMARLERTPNGWVKIPDDLMRGNPAVDSAATLAVAMWEAFETAGTGARDLLTFDLLDGAGTRDDDPGWIVQLRAHVRDAAYNADSMLVTRQIVWLIRSADDRDGLDRGVRYLIAGAS